MIPAVALADEAAADDTTDGIELLAGDVVSAFNNGSVTAAALNGKAITDDLTKLKYTADGTTTYAPTPTAVTDATGKVVDLTDTAEFNAVAFYTDIDADGKYDPDAAKEGGATALASAPSAAGKYLAVVIGKGATYTSSAIAVLPFEIEAATMGDVTAFVGAEVNDDAIVFDNAVKTINFTLDGKTALTADTDYTVSKLYKDGVEVTDGLAYDDAVDANDVKYVNAEVVSVLDAGSYIAILAGKGTYAATTTEVKFTVEALDLSKATIAVASPYSANPGTTDASQLTLSDITVTPAGSTTAIAGDDLDDYIDIAFTSASNGRSAYDPATAGAYTYTVSAKANQKNVANSGTVTYTVADAQLGTTNFTYNAATWAATYDVDHSAATPAPDFDISKIAVKDDASKDVPFTVTVTDADDNAVTDTVLSKPGTYTVKVTVDSAACDYKYAGEETVTVTVTEGVIDLDTNLFYAYQGTALDTPLAAAITYTGVDQLPDFGTVIKGANGKTLVAGTDYTVKVEDKDGNEVTEIVDVAGSTYTVSVESDSYTFQNADTNKLVITLNPLALTKANLRSTDALDEEAAGADAAAETLYTYEITEGDTLDLGVEWGLEKDDDLVWSALDSGLYTASFQLGTFNADGTSFTADATADPVEEVTEEGIYEVTLTETDADGYDNFGWTAAKFYIKVSYLDDLFKDVPVGDVFYDVIREAKELGIVHGYDDNNFRPNKTITRAEVATILYNAATVKDPSLTDNDETSPAGNAFQTYETGFDDVANTYWAAPFIGWAKAAGVVNGNGGKFRPNDNVTREEFAAMLANYAKAVENAKIEAGDEPISRVKDFDKVSSWAKSSVEWAVTNKFMGNGGTVNPKSNATRAEVTAMLMNYLETTDLFEE